MPTFPNPGNLQLRYGFETTEGLGDVASLLDMRVRSETLGGNFPLLPNDDIIAGAEMAEGSPTKIDPSGDVNLNWSPEDHGRILANFFQHGDTPQTLDTGAYLHGLAPDKTDIDFRSLALEASRDNGRPDLYVGAQVSAIDFALQPSGFMTGKATLLIPRFHSWAEAAAVSLDASPTLPVLRGLPTYDNMVATDGDIFGKVTTAPGGGSMGVKYKIGASSNYTSAPEITVTAETWGDVITEDGQAGEDGAEVQAYYPSLTGFAVDDEFKVARERDVWVQSLPVSSPANEILASVFVDGELFRLNNLQFTAQRPIIKDLIVGGRFTDTMIEQGKRNNVATIKRRFLNLNLQNKIMYAKAFALRMDIKGLRIGSTQIQRRISLISLNAKPSGKTASVQNANTYEDNITAQLHPSNDVNYPASLSCEVVNSQATLQS